MPDLTETLSLLSFSIREAPSFTRAQSKAFTQGGCWPGQAPQCACVPAKGQMFQGCAQGNPLDPKMRSKVKARKPRGLVPLSPQQ